MNLKVDQRYNTFSIKIVLHLIHNSKQYNDLWVKNYPDTETAASNFFNDSNCGCKPVLLSQYKKDKFNADVMTVNFINENPESINLEEIFKDDTERDLHGHIFSIPEGEGHFKDFISTIQEKRYSFKFFNTTKMDNKIFFTFF